MNITLKFKYDPYLESWIHLSPLNYVNLCNAKLCAYLPIQLRKFDKISIRILDKSPVEVLETYHRIELSNDRAFWFAKGKYDSVSNVIAGKSTLLEKLCGGKASAVVWIRIKPIY